MSSDDEFAAWYWEDRYRSGVGAGRHEPSPSLVQEAGELPVGRALDAGCGAGSDARWLASRGWQVTAVDVSDTAVAGARDATDGGLVDWVQGDLSVWEPDGPGFDLVTSHFVHVPGPMTDLVARLASWVAPGGTLLVVGHADQHDPEAAASAAGHGHPRDHGPGPVDGHLAGPAHDAAHRHDAGDGHAAPGRPAAAQLQAEQATAVLPADEWEVLSAGTRTYELTTPEGVLTRRDTVVRARRRPVG